MKFNYMKKNDKSRNLKAVRNQIQQIEIYIEKLVVSKTFFFSCPLVSLSVSGHVVQQLEDICQSMKTTNAPCAAESYDRGIHGTLENFHSCVQVLKKKMQTFTTKVSTSTEKHMIGSSPREIEDAVNELQRQLGDFDRTVEEYKQNLDLTVKLQQAVEEVGFGHGGTLKTRYTLLPVCVYYFK